MDKLLDGTQLGCIASLSPHIQQTLVKGYVRVVSAIWVEQFEQDDTRLRDLVKSDLSAQTVDACSGKVLWKMSSTGHVLW